MDHMLLQLQEEHHASPMKHCDPGASVPGRRCVNGLHVVAAFAAAIASLAMLLSFFSMRDSPASMLPPRRLLAVGSLVVSKKALFVLSNAIFLLLAVDCCCFFTACGPSGDLHKQLLHHHEEVEQCAVQLQSCVSYSATLHRKTSNTAPEASTNPVISEEQEEQEDEDAVAASSIPESCSHDDEAGSVALETVIVEEPTCGRDQELEELEIHELNRKFDEFIQSRRIRWIKEEESLLPIATGLTCCKQM